ncbi:hypothetical protein DHEL01_v205920 [Diaporthe helianthi]|uniref:Uncharacterized protein n=1 Tax=Diaporthe helianthi TaxID=158607 RepID=A0A2P5HZK4_DIAHE|nr:hypothetical protein DHEL01_v205920 [Diaporthe helianthi]
MSRAGFSIRKLITQRRTWPDSDSDNEDALECSSAKTIRMQYELEQYQQQLLQKELRHAHKTRSSWMSNNSSPKRKTYKRAPKPIVVVGHASGGVIVHSGSASRRISTPLPASALSGLSGVLSPGSAHLHSSDDSLSSSGDDCGLRHHRHQRAHSDSNAAPSAAAAPTKPRLSTPIMTAGGALCPVATPTRATKKPSYEGRSFLDIADTVSPNPESAFGDQNGTSFPQPTTTTTATNSHTLHINRTPTAVKATISYTAATADRDVIAISAHQPRNPRYVNSTESYTLKPPIMQNAKDRQVRDEGLPRAVQDPSKVSEDDENTFEGLLEGKDHHDCDHLPDNVRQLIWETDEAFKAVGTAMAEARLASQSHPQSKQLQEQVSQLQRASQALQIQTKSLDSTLVQTLLPTTYQAPVSRVRKDSVVSSPLSPTAGRGSITSFPRKNKSSPASSSDTMLRSPTHASSIKKAKRKTPSRPRTPRSATIPTPTTSAWPDTPAPTSKASTFGPSASSAEGNGSTSQRQQNSYRSLSRWNLKADNVTEKLFNGSRGRFGFHKIEADEVVTPGQVQQYRQSRIAKAQAEAQAETKRPDSNGSLRSAGESVGGAVSDGISVKTPIDPFHIQGLPSRIGNAGANLGILSPVVEVLTPKSSTFDLDIDLPRKSTPTEPKTPTTATQHPKQEQAPLATPPPTPPQPSPNASAARLQAPSGASPDEDTASFFKSYSFPDPPVKEATHGPTHKRGNSSSSRVPILSSIPEVLIISPPSQDGHPKPQNSRRPSEMHMAQPSPRLSPTDTPNFEEDDEHLFFKSTPLTLTMPSFEHGRIRLAKADLINAGTINSLESKLLSSPDETLDWTAFQMAILGGAGDFFSDPSDFCARDAEEELVDELCDWLEGFGLPTDAMGALVKTEEKAPTMRPIMPYSQAHVSVVNPPGSGSRSFHDPSRDHSINHIVNGSSSPCSGSARSSGEVSEGVQEMLQVQSMPIPIDSEHPSGFWNTRPLDAARFYTGGGIKRWTLEGHPKRYQGPGVDVDKADKPQHGGAEPSPEGVEGERVKLREGVDSLPQSPMLDLVMTTGVDGSKEYVPMGYNLGHDLGDFLKWESENVYAFYGSD